jgi:uncharacterized damage-inducible protein DinB
MIVVMGFCYPNMMFDLDEFLHYFGRVRERTRRIAPCIPAEQIDWTYKPGAFTLGDLVRHIAVTERFIWAETVHDRPCGYSSHGKEQIYTMLGMLNVETPPLYGMTASEVQARATRDP